MPTITRTSLGSDFDAFLFAPVGEDKQGMLVSVLSVLARLNLDPWEEAARLARLPGDAAKKALVSLISSISSTLSANVDPGKIASRLAKLLPKQTGPTIRTLETITNASAAVKPQDMTTAIVINVLFFIFILGTQFFAASHMPAAQVFGATAPTTQIGVIADPLPAADH